MLVVVLQVQVQEVYTHMVQQSKVITISGRPGIGKTEVGDSIRSIGSLVELLRNWQRGMQKLGHIRFKNLEACVRPK